jgi:hypothetical protein
MIPRDEVELFERRIPHRGVDEALRSRSSEKNTKYIEQS